MASPIKKTFGYKERDDEKRRLFKEKLEGIEASRVIYLDESGIRTNEAKEYGWSRKGHRLHDLRSGTSRKALNIIAALHQDKLIAPFLFEGRCDTAVFNTYLSEVLKPHLKPDHVLVLDNASFHRASKIKNICQSIGCRLEFLPPYSPDFNDIEHHWFSIKTKLRKLMSEPGGSLMELMGKVFMSTE